jgi:deoxyribonuclease V
MGSWACQVPDLKDALRELLAQIPCGRVTTYGNLADALGLRSAARWVGEYLRDHPHTASCPCHRVVRKDGALGLYLRHQMPIEKERRLQAEGVPTTEAIVDRLEDFLFREFRTDQPLRRLVDLQNEIAQRVHLTPNVEMPRLVAGLDVSYGSDGTAVGAAAVVEASSGQLIWSKTCRRKVDLPYIPSLLTFRELPMLMALFEETQSQDFPVDLYLVDGNGILHPRGAGVAACFGVVADVPTIGVAKSQLCGRVESQQAQEGNWSPIFVNDKVMGALWVRSPSAHALFVSPGQNIDVPSAVRIAARLDFGHRLSEPLYWADRLSRAEARRPPG